MFQESFFGSLYFLSLECFLEFEMLERIELKFEMSKSVKTLEASLNTN